MVDGVNFMIAVKLYTSWNSQESWAHNETDDEKQNVTYVLSRLKLMLDKKKSSALGYELEDKENNLKICAFLCDICLSFIDDQANKKIARESLYPSTSEYELKEIK